jgi:hypothetical protein
VIFDASDFASACVEPVARLLPEDDDPQAARIELSALRQDLEATFADLEATKDPLRLSGFARDLRTFLPSRRDEIVRLLPSKTPPPRVLKIEAALLDLERAALLVVRAFGAS